MSKKPTDPENSKKVFLIDGYPRNDDNVQAWKKYENEVNLVGCLNFICSFETMKASWYEDEDLTLPIP